MEGNSFLPSWQWVRHSIDICETITLLEVVTGAHLFLQFFSFYYIYAFHEMSLTNYRFNVFLLHMALVTTFTSHFSFSFVFVILNFYNLLHRHVILNSGFYHTVSLTQNYKTRVKMWELKLMHLVDLQ